MDLKPAMKEYMFQSTLPYGERHITEIFHKSVDYVSIHAPVWGATGTITAKDRFGLVFQSTLPYGERPMMGCRKEIINSFNPRSRMGSDPNSKEGDSDDPVSIHAPVWGATPTICFPGESKAFQSTLPYGERHAGDFALKSQGGVSIHAPVWGATRCNRWVERIVSFNPRSRMGSDSNHVQFFYHFP